MDRRFATRFPASRRRPRHLPQARLLRDPLAQGRGFRNAGLLACLWTRRMRIAYVITRADAVGGATIHVRDLARAMRDRSHETLVLVGGSGPVTDQLKAAGVPFHSLRHLRRPIHPVRDFLAYRELIEALP